MTEATSSRVLDAAAAPPDVAAAHFLHRLAVETDPADVHADMCAGVGGFVVVDTRAREAYREAHVPGAISLPNAEMAARAAEVLSRDDLVVVYCWGPHCNGATKGAAQLAQLGFRVKEMIGGIDGWRRDGLAVATGDEPG